MIRMWLGIGYMVTQLWVWEEIMTMELGNNNRILIVHHQFKSSTTWTSLKHLVMDYMYQLKLMEHYGMGQMMYGQLGQNNETNIHHQFKSR